MSKKVIIIIAAVFFVMMGMMGTGFFIIWKQMSAAVAQVQQGNNQEDAEAAAVEETEVNIGPLYKLDTLIVNLADHGGKRYLRITMEMELKPADEVDTSDLVEEMDRRLPQIRDTILMILPSKTYADISDTTGKIALRDQIISQLNGLLKKGQISTIFFTEFVIQ